MASLDKKAVKLAIFKQRPLECANSSIASQYRLTVLFVEHWKYLFLCIQTLFVVYIDRSSNLLRLLTSSVLNKQLIYVLFRSIEKLVSN